LKVHGRVNVHTCCTFEPALLIYLIFHQAGPADRMNTQQLHNTDRDAVVHGARVLIPASVFQRAPPSILPPRAAFGEYFLSKNHSRDFLQIFHRRNTKYALHFLKSTIEPKLLSLPFKLHPILQVCQHHHVCTNKAKCVSIFTIIFSKELS
jgi:hypothetical protein